MIRFGKEICSHLEEASQREWLETNGIGGFASSTIAGINTRRYHGLLVAALTPPVGRYVLLSKFEESLTVGSRTYELSANRYPGVIHPQGYQYLAEFRFDPFPTFVYHVAGVEIEKTVFLVHGENAVVIEYELRALSTAPASSAILQLHPLIAFRDYHSLTHENTGLNATCELKAGLVSVKPYPDLPALHLVHNARAIEPTGVWFRRFQYEAEQERGLDFTEDLHNPCVLTFDLASQSARVIAALRPANIASVPDLRNFETARRAAIRADSPSPDPFIETLTVASEQFLVNRGERKSVIAGYHWFSNWGRDTMISLAGLSVPNGRASIARDILRTFAQSVDRGMLPNRFPDAGETPEYNTVDATLWFFEAVRAYLARTGDIAFVRDELYNILADIIAWHVRGTRYNIHVDSDGLLNSGEDGVQLTWMDAKVGDWVVTPRRGKPVEIQALWYNALCVMEDLAAKVGDELGRKRYATQATLTKWSFNRLFWNESTQCLYDMVKGDDRDASIRPNQVFAVSLRHSMLQADRALRVVEVVQQQLLTLYGLRTLSPSDPGYRGRYTGDQRSRDGAYHQGTVWPWLLGPFLSAYLRVHGRGDAAKRQAREWLQPLRQHLLDRGVGQINEIFEGDPPHRPVGCIAQAWSIAELLRTWVDLQVGASALDEKTAGTDALPVATQKA